MVTRQRVNLSGVSMCIAWNQTPIQVWILVKYAYNKVHKTRINCLRASNPSVYCWLCVWLYENNNLIWGNNQANEKEAAN